MVVTLSALSLYSSELTISLFNVVDVQSCEKEPYVLVSVYVWTSPLNVTVNSAQPEQLSRLIVALELFGLLIPYTKLLIWFTL